MAMARPSWAIWATLLACSLVRGASVATTARVVLRRAEASAGAAALSNRSTLSRKPRLSVFRGPATRRPVVGVYDAAKSVDCDEGSDDVIANPSAGATEAALHSTVGAEGLADGRACACTHRALGGGRGVGGGAGLVAVLGAGADGGVADGQVEEDGRGHYGYDADAHGKADASLFEVGHHPVGGGEAVGAASAEDNGVGLLDKVKGSKKVGLTGAGCGAANVDAADRALWAEDHGAARDGYRVGVMTDLNAWYVGNRVVQQKTLATRPRGFAIPVWSTRSGSYGCRPLGLCRARGCDAYRRSRSAAGVILLRARVGVQARAARSVD